MKRWSTDIWEKMYLWTRRYGPNSNSRPVNTKQRLSSFATDISLVLLNACACKGANPSSNPTRDRIILFWPVENLESTQPHKNGTRQFSKCPGTCLGRKDHLILLLARNGKDQHFKSQQQYLPWDNIYLGRCGKICTTPIPNWTTLGSVAMWPW